MSERFTSHVAAGELALYVMGALEGERCVAVEAHVMGCGACAESLAREARLEAAFDEVALRAARHEAESARVASIAAHVARRPRAVQRSRFMGSVAGMLAAAAAILLMFAETSHADQGFAAAQPRAGAYDGAVGDISGAFVGEQKPDKLDGG